MHRYTFSIPVVKSIAFLQVLPVVTLLMGGILGWKFWQQQKRNEKNLLQLANHLNDVKKDFLKQQIVQKNTPTQMPTPSNKPLSASKHGLFKQIIDENIVLRRK